MNHIFIVNPVAGKGKTLRAIPQIENFFKSKPEHSFEILYTEGKGHATCLAKQAVSQGVGRIYSVGGDGTLNEVLNGMIDSNFSLGIIPLGSGNDFIKNVCNGFYKELPIENFIDGTEKYIDCAKANDTYFINVASVGFDAEVAQNTLLFKNLPLISGSLAYILSIFYSLVQNKPYKLTYNKNGDVDVKKCLLVAICNGKYYGGGFMPAPNADINDGLFDICSVKYLKRLKILKCFPKLKTGTHTSMKEVEIFKTPAIRIKCDDDLFLNLDGEISQVNKIEFQLLPNRLKILVPKII